MQNGRPVLIEPDLDFIRALSNRVGDVFKKCMQCGTCSATCTISPDHQPFPCKEMAWANWGMKDRLLGDADVWLCFQCTDCSTRCPRGARPGDVLAAIRQKSVEEYSFPRFLARWVNQPQYIPLLLGLPIVLLTLVLYLKSPLENALGISRYAVDNISYSYTSMFPHWLLNSFFGIISLLVILSAAVGLRRFWRAMRSAENPEIGTERKSLLSCFLITLKSVITHNKFADCKAAHTRYYSHLSVFFGFIALSLVSIWVFTSGVNPLIRGAFIYPFGFFSPWKLLANLGGLALLFGLLLMIRDRLKDRENAPVSAYFDWSLIAMLLVAVLTGFFAEVLHYIRLEPHRHVAYFVHLVIVCALLMYLPYSKFAHLIYRTTAMVYSEYSGRNSGAIQTVSGTFGTPAGEDKAAEMKDAELVGSQVDSLPEENP